MPALQESIDAVRVAAKAANDGKAMDIIAFDVSQPLAITDIFMVASGDNERHVLAVADTIERHLHDELGLTPQAREGLDEAKWILLDYSDFVIHIMHRQARKFYDLERLWSDCPPVPLDLEHPLSTGDFDQKASRA
ncbi:iojap-like protein [Bifidobacterium actinocoloniiforme DSM 22766]|uniref:Ribosomal silencing factor RsfS n=1 Tax=Bifidobacterium actinocoloniiforme DSM 22766 TaxID=1437605 RepID=A0A086Z0M4_9BIFI|nr:ribosome silencing factor [Bifidobacterium actinocoloniiforme]AKV55288.1 ribosome-associated protein IOJAP [Bifidobacterium actinocoloniiforme DSM 22766]KFI40074.1 iojap-like protein [Bifidobacterium actinocoloniiforme DSM 22766]